ncbi:probable LRR receptor-like serine/threonine-protein kinase At4g20940 isoform X2 [Asparagus officinalis]|uniref:probable LRR receptor-like serine/threonine-protein kinase At4g20940 isoform X1 n=1 Tax=Asparagus officinalis TaxID=4686 RepID=UPI00098E1C67|nr:probable LRR receptor-like serine/threonine-protein kinase At4g20940 isoform X1 [Asparagus officinalis]XP_020276194.1 probable LRR receptor-like serine/threonine-protein kinase At4g20940 isoform X2 [Asparagus officinalis]
MNIFEIVCFIFFFLIPAQSQLPSSDILALLAFKKGITNDPTGYITDSWNEESIDFNGCPSSWNGILCNGGKVAAIVLDNHGISGTADLSVFSNLTLLFKISMKNNNFTGMLPDDIDGFQSLKFLDVSNNLLFGKVPDSFGNLKSLQNLSLSGNNFSGSIPNSIGGLGSIQSLDLSKNSLSGSLPSALKSLKRLVYLDLSFNTFSKGIPAVFADIPSLEFLDLSWNQLDGGVPWSLLMESKIVHVDLSGNLLRSSNAEEMKFLAEVSETVKYLNLSNNQLTGSLIDGGEMSTFGSLKVLDLSYNQLSGPLPGFDYVYDLEVLRLGNNGFDGFLPNGLLKGDSLVLSELDLSANNLSGNIGWITSTTLQTLNLSSNTLSGDLPLLIGSCRILDLSKNQLSGNISVTSKWGNDLEFIDLSQNQLTGPIPEVTSQFLRLNYLNLSHNSLSSTLPKVLLQYPKLTILDLSSNKFDGHILTDLLTSSTLQELNLGNNQLFGEIVFSPSLSYKSDLQALNLSSNRFNGTFPDNLTSLSRLQVLDISTNNFSGLLPPSITNLTYLNSLDISLNQFTGPLPSNLPDTLMAFNASYNDLSGPIPANLQKFPDTSFHPGNSRLESPAGHPNNGTSPSERRGHKHLKTSIKIAIIAICIVAFVLLILLTIFVHYKKISRSHPERVTDKNLERKAQEPGRPLVVSAQDLLPTPRKGPTSEAIGSKEKMPSATGSSPSKTSHFSWSPDSGEAYPQENLSKLDVRSPDSLAGELYFLDETITLTPEELSRAPAEVLGRSSHGTSYRATLDNGVFLTVKWLREGVAKPKKEFAKEAKKFANIRHPNVVGLRGYYWGPTQHEKLILSDYISPGSLANFLYDRPGRRGPPLTWAQRLKIAVDVARGLNYLHFDRAVPHGNLKSTNILLDGLDLNARVSDYCLHRLMTQSGTTEQILDSGVLGYRAPELTSSKKPSPSFKSDAYAFGVVMLELLTGKCAGDVISGDEGGVDLCDWVRLRVAEGRGSDCFDGELGGEIAGNLAAGKGMKEMLGIALRCIRPVSERPGIRSVYEDLSSI